MRWQSIPVLRHRSNQVANRKFIFREHMAKIIADPNNLQTVSNNVQHSRLLHSLVVDSVTVYLPTNFKHPPICQMSRQQLPIVNFPLIYCLICLRRQLICVYLCNCFLFSENRVMSSSIERLRNFFLFIHG